MIPGDISDAPTLACLNKPQKRALILRDQLRYLEPAHLDSFLVGVTTDEPPTYRKVNSTVRPPLTQITIKEDATRFDLGNVQFPEEGGVIYRAYLTVEDKRFEMRTEDALPKDDAELGSVAIHRFVAENMFPLFKAKYKAIHARMEKINEARRVAYNMLDHPPARFEEGETMMRLHPAKPNEDSSRGKFMMLHVHFVNLQPAGGGPHKRKDIAKHISNKRQRIGLDTIPDNVKCETFNTIPAQIKVDLFNNIIKTAFPNVNNLIVASWNVVSVYANVGSDFPELHKAVVELKGALEEFESAYAPSRTKNGKGRKEATPNPQNSVNPSRTSTPVPEVVREARNTPVPSAPSNPTTANQTQMDGEGTDQHHQDEKDTPKHQMPPPHTHQARQQSREGSIKADTHQPATPTAPDTCHTSPRAPSLPRHTHSLNPPHSTPPPYNAHRTTASNGRRTNPRPSPSSHPHQHQHPQLNAPGTELMRKRQEYTASLNRTNDGGYDHQHQQQQNGYEGGYEQGGYAAEQDRDIHASYEQGRRTPAGGGGGGQFKGLGSSVLGVRKAAVAPMVHTKSRGGQKCGHVGGSTG